MKTAYARLVGQETPAREARNGWRHIAALSMSKLADGLIDPKLVLSWLMTALGVPAAVIAMVVPIREVGALLPQILLAGRVQRMPQRYRVWVAGSLGQGVAAGLIALVALTMSGLAAGVAICALLAGLAVARAACSVSHKDVLGKTVAQTRRGAVSGAAGSVSAALVLVYALLLLSGGLRAQGAVAGAVALAGLLWVCAALIFARMEESPSPPDDSTPRSPADYLQILREDANLRRFILVRGLLVSTALAPPYLVILQAQDGALTQQLGGLLLAASAASFLSSYVWGRLSDSDSPRVMLVAGLGAAAAMALAVLSALAGWAGQGWVIPMILFALMLAYHGVRQSRAVYLVDISDENRRSVNAALANTAIGLAVLVTGALGGVLSLFGPTVALTGYAVMAALGAGLAPTLRRP